MDAFSTIPRRVHGAHGRGTRGQRSSAMERLLHRAAGPGLSAGRRMVYLKRVTAAALRESAKNKALLKKMIKDAVKENSRDSEMAAAVQRIIALEVGQSQATISRNIGSGIFVGTALAFLTVGYSLGIKVEANKIEVDNELKQFKNEINNELKQDKNEIDNELKQQAAEAARKMGEMEQNLMELKMYLASRSASHQASPWNSFRGSFRP